MARASSRPRRSALYLALHPSALFPSALPLLASTPLTVLHTPYLGTPPYQGEYVTVLIGYNDAVGQPAAGIVYRPLTEPVTHSTAPHPTLPHPTPPSCQPSLAQPSTLIIPTQP